jgi:hypothetical protein
MSRGDSIFHAHLKGRNHSLNPDCTSVLSTELNFARREVKEAIKIKTRRPSLNRDGGYKLPPVYDQLLSKFNST